jgi:alkanesulfonate monooxygenase SsuD/methylene tetrahydromethanopterin reductase-like flavin-dependent oxidoreductase (luciferase family)
VLEPAPLRDGKIPIVIGGAGRKTMELVAAHADWWNVHVSILDKFDEMRPLAGRARASLQVQVAFVGPGHEAEREDIDAAAGRRFWGGHVLGNGSELVDYFGALAERGVERAYVWFTDFAPAETLEAFGQTVIKELSPRERTRTPPRA